MECWMVLAGFFHTNLTVRYLCILQMCPIRYVAKAACNPNCEEYHQMYCSYILRLSWSISVLYNMTRGGIRKHWNYTISAVPVFANSFNKLLRYLAAKYYYSQLSLKRTPNYYKQIVLMLDNWSHLNSRFFSFILLFFNSISRTLLYATDSWCQSLTVKVYHRERWLLKFK